MYNHTECILYKGHINYNGYGSASMNNKTILAHRKSYIINKGDIPKGLVIDHLCKVKSCINPEHLEAVTQKENVKRGNMTKRNLSKTKCPQGHNYSGSNLIIDNRGYRECRTCKYKHNTESKIRHTV
jgi:hypothetical protein